MSVTAMLELYRAASRPTSGFRVGHGRSARYALPGPADGGLHAGPERLVRGELPPEVGNKLRNLIVGHAVLETGHVAEIARDGRRDTVQDHLDKIVRHGTVQIAVQRQRRPAAEQSRATDLMANRAGALIETRANRR